MCAIKLSFTIHVADLSHETFAKSSSVVSSALGSAGGFSHHCHLADIPRGSRFLSVFFGFSFGVLHEPIAKSEAEYVLGGFVILINEHDILQIDQSIY